MQLMWQLKFFVLFRATKWINWVSQLLWCQKLFKAYCFIQKTTNSRNLCLVFDSNLISYSLRKTLILIKWNRIKVNQFKIKIDIGIIKSVILIKDIRMNVLFCILIPRVYNYKINKD